MFRESLRIYLHFDFLIFHKLKASELLVKIIYFPKEMQTNISQSTEDFLASLNVKLEGDSNSIADAKPQPAPEQTTKEKTAEKMEPVVPQPSTPPVPVPHYSSIRGHDYSTALRVLKEPIKDLIHELKNFSHFLRCNEHPFKALMNFVKERSPTTEVTEVEIGSFDNFVNFPGYAIGQKLSEDQRRTHDPLLGKIKDFWRFIKSEEYSFTSNTLWIRNIDPKIHVSISAPFSSQNLDPGLVFLSR